MACVLVTGSLVAVDVGADCMTAEIEDKMPKQQSKIFRSILVMCGCTDMRCCVIHVFTWCICG